MEIVRTLINVLLMLCFITLVLGLYKPWVVLWWEDKQNRKKVMLVYGSGVLILMAAKLLLL